jgi:hypothetical protein
MTRLLCFRVAMVIMAVVAMSVAASVAMAQAAPLSEGAAASGGVAQSGNCPGGQQQDEHCLPGGPGSPARPGGPIHPPVTPPVPPPVTPPVVPPIVPPPGIPSATRPQDPELPLYINGWAKATLHIHDDDRDVIYTATAYWERDYASEKVPLNFIRRDVQDIPGNTQYILAPYQLSHEPNLRDGYWHITWKAEGREFDCTVKGEAIIPFPTKPDPNIAGGRAYLDPTENLTENITQPAYGYLNVVGPDGGDFHSVMIKAFSNEASLIKTCPGDPPLVTKENFQAGFLLHILWQKNTREDGRVIFKGQQTYDMDNPLGLLDMLPPGENQERARPFLNSAETSGTSVRYTWQWELYPTYRAR